MPYEAEHAARISNPDKYAKFRRENDKFGKGIDVIWGITDAGKTEIQSIRFDASKFSATEAKKWLKDHDYKPIEFAEASKDDGKSIDSNSSNIEHKTFKFNLASVEEIKANDSRYGIIKGYASTFGNVDRGNDIIVKGAFVKSLDWYRKEGKLIPMCYQHSMMHPIGGFSPSKMYEDEKGLYVEGEINLDTEKGKEAYALAKQGVISDMSIGFTCNDYDLGMEDDSTVRKIKEVQLWEISPVIIPMNPQAKITDVKNIVTIEDLGKEEDLEILDDNVIDDNTLLEMKKSQIERVLRETGRFSRSAVKHIVSCLKFHKKEDRLNLDNQELSGLLNSVKQRDAVQNKNIVNDRELCNLLNTIKAYRR